MIIQEPKVDPYNFFFNLLEVGWLWFLYSNWIIANIALNTITRQTMCFIQTQLQVVLDIAVLLFQYVNLQTCWKYILYYTIWYNYRAIVIWMK